MNEIEKQQLTYRMIGAVLGIMVVGGVIYGISSVVDAFDVALNPNLIKPPQAVTFNLDLAKKLRLVR